MKKLNTIDADTLQTISYEPITFLVNDLLPQDCTCWPVRQRSESPGWRCGCVFKWHG